MKIAIYYPWVYSKSGVEKTILAMVSDKRNQYTIFTNHYDKQSTFEEFSDLEVVELDKVSVKRDLLNVLKAAFTIAKQKIDLNDYDLLLVNSEGLGDLILLKNSYKPVICFCHTPLRPVFDLYYKTRILETYNTSKKILFYFFSKIFTKIDRLLWKKYDRIIFNSKESFNRAIRGGLVSKSSTKWSILNPPSMSDNKNISKTFNNYFLLPGRIMWTKNIELAINGFVNFKKDSAGKKNYKLIIAGHLDAKSQQYLENLKKLTKTRNDIQFVIDPDQKELDLLYLKSMCVVSSAFNEDWGLTLLEANAFGKGVIAIDRGGPKESQINQETAILIKESTKAMSEAFSKMAKVKYAKKLGRNAFQLSKKYNKKYFIDKLNKQFQLVSDSRKLPR